MLPVAHLLADLDGALGRRSDDRRAEALRRVTDLFLLQAEALDDEQRDLFDAVILRLAKAIEIGPRVALAERLAPVSCAPSGIVMFLAQDDIPVARPILSLSPRLDDQSLLAVVVGRGSDHRRAICDRASLSTLVTDVLVAEGDARVHRALAGHEGARLSQAGMATLLHHARTDPDLQTLLAGRSDRPRLGARDLIEIARDFAGSRVATSLAASHRPAPVVVEVGPVSEVAALTPAPPAELAPTQLATESDVAGLAEAGRLPDTVAALSVMTGLPGASVARVFADRDSDLLIVIGKARGWSWRTVRALLTLRDPSLTERHHFRVAAATYSALSTTTARRALQVLKLRERAHAAGAAR